MAYDPGVALTLLDRYVPQVAVLDIGLPGIDGYELAARIRAHRNGSRCHLVALTGYGTAADIAQAHAAGFRRHLVKPVAPEELLRAVQRDHRHVIRLLATAYAEKDVAIAAVHRIDRPVPHELRHARIAVA